MKSTTTSPKMSEADLKGLGDGQVAYIKMMSAAEAAAAFARHG